MIKDFEKRPTATELKAHPFISQVESMQVRLKEQLKQIIDKQKILLNQMKRLPYATTKHGKLKSKRKSKPYINMQKIDDLATLENLDEVI